MPDDNDEPKDGDVVLQARGVTKRFGDKTVLENLDLDLRKGESLVILGGSGSGKSTLLKMLYGALPTDEGSIRILDMDICGMTERQLDEYRLKIGVLFQSGALFNSMNLFDNVALPMREHTDLPDSTIEVMVKIKLEQVGLRDAAYRMPAELSGGMKKRAGLARAMALDPKLLFYDEPSAGLDPVTSSEIDELIIDLNEKLGVTTVVITHEMDSALRIADRMVLLDQGKFVAGGTPEEMRASADPLVHQFMYGLTEGPLSKRRKGDAYAEDLLTPDEEA